MGAGPGAIRPARNANSAARRDAVESSDRARPAPAVERAADEVHLTEQALAESAGVERREAPNASLDEARMNEIRERIASGAYETDEVLSKILSGLEADEPRLFLA